MPRSSRNGLVGLVLVLVAGAVFFLASYGVSEPYAMPGETTSSLGIFTNDPTVVPRVSIYIDPPSGSKLEGTLFVTFDRGVLPDDFRWAIVGNEKLTLTINEGASSGDTVKGLYAKKMVDGCDPSSGYPGPGDGYPRLAEFLVVGTGSEFWIPGELGLGHGGGMGTARTLFVFDFSMKSEGVFFEGPETYLYDIGWFGHFMSYRGDQLMRSDEQCISVDGIGEVWTQPNEQYELTVRARSATDRVIFAEPAAQGQGQVTWEQPVGLVKVTFEDTAKKRLNQALLFLSGVLTGVGTGVWSSAIARESPRREKVR